MDDNERRKELTADEVERFARTLRDVRDDLQEMLESSRAAIRPVDLDEPIGRLTRIDAIQQQQVSAAGRRGAAARLRLVEQALRLVDSGEYGLCRRCEESIGAARLGARPETPYCVDCQDEIDRRHTR